MNPLRPGSVLNATVAIAPRKGTCGLNRACWAYASHTLPVWMARCMILQVSISCCLPGRLVSNKPLVHLRVCVYQQSLLILRQATEKLRVFLAEHFTLSHVTFYDTISFQSGQVARELEFLLIHTGSRITSPLVQRTTAMPHDTGTSLWVNVWIQYLIFMKQSKQFDPSPSHLGAFSHL